MNDKQDLYIEEPLCDYCEDRKAKWLTNDGKDHICDSDKCLAEWARDGRKLISLEAL